MNIIRYPSKYFPESEQGPGRHDGGAEETNVVEANLLMRAIRDTLITIIDDLGGIQENMFGRLPNGSDSAPKNNTGP